MIELLEELNWCVVTDGNISVNLHDIFQVQKWIPSLPVPKNGGVWRSTPYQPGRQLIMREYENVSDTFELTATSKGGINDIIRETRKLRGLLEKAANYWVVKHADEPVWVEIRGKCETNIRYATIKDYRTPNDDDPFSEHMNSIPSVMEGFTLVLEHDFWQDVYPGSSESLPATANDGTYGITTETEENNCFFANKHNAAPLTDIYYYDASGAAFSANILGAALPQTLLPAIPAVNDIIYFGIDTAVPGTSGPFNSLIFDVGTAQVDLTLVWQYYNGGWVNLAVADNTDDGGQPLDTVDVNGVHWDTPADWITVAINGVTAYWVRLFVQAVGAAPSPPIQQNRDIYTVTWNNIQIDGDNLDGDISTLILENILEETAFSNLSIAANSRIVVGIRSKDRGENFTPFLNCGDEQNPTGLSYAVNGTTVIGTYLEKTPTGRSHYYQPSLTSTTLIARGTFTFTPALSLEYKGRFHAFFRCYYDSTPTADDTSFQYQLQVKFSGYPIYVSDIQETQLANERAIIDFGEFDVLSNYGSEALANLTMEIHVGNSTPAVNTNKLYFGELIVLPVDEWVGDFFKTGENIGAASNYIRLDSVTNPKRNIQVKVIGRTTGYLYYLLTPITTGAMSFPVNSDINIWSLVFTGSDGDLGQSDFPWAARVDLEKVDRYLSMRGDG